MLATSMGMAYSILQGFTPPPTIDSGSPQSSSPSLAILSSLAPRHPKKLVTTP